MKILIVDDEPTVLMMVESLVAVLLSAETVVCNNADEAIEALEEDEFDGVITDFEMPRRQGGNGDRVIAKALAKGIPVERIVVMSGNIAEYQELILSLGVPIQNLLAKPPQRLGLELKRVFALKPIPA